MTGVQKMSQYAGVSIALKRNCKMAVKCSTGCKMATESITK